MRGSAACRVLASRSKHAAVGDYVSSWIGWTQYAIVPDGRFEPASRYPGLQSPRDMLSTLGITGLTAWWGMTQIGDPKPGETVVVSGAAGATGSVAGQIAKIKGARVIGICGSEDKCQWLRDDLGFDVALNYKAENFRKAFKEATKNYIDVYYDNGKHKGIGSYSLTRVSHMLTRHSWRRHSRHGPRPSQGTCQIRGMRCHQPVQYLKAPGTKELCERCLYAHSDAGLHHHGSHCFVAQGTPGALAVDR